MTGRTPTPTDLVLAEFTRERAAWINTAKAAVEGLSFAAGAWLCGSLGRAAGDGFSDVDLVVAVDPGTPSAVIADPIKGLRLPGPVLYTRPKPRNAPTGGSYLAVGIELTGLPLLVDLYLWPAATTAVPAGARVLFERDPLPHTDRSFLELLNQHRATDHTGSDPSAPGTVLMLIQLAAKYLARADTARLAGIARQLALTADPDGALLWQILAERVDLDNHPQLRPAVAAVARLLALAEAVQSRRLGRPNGGQP